MAYPALKKFSYWGQFGVLLGFTGAGIVIAGLIQTLLYIQKLGINGMQGKSSSEIMDMIMVPANANFLRFAQFLGTMFFFFIPTWAYAKLCHKRASTHLGLKQPVNFQQFLVVVVIFIACLPFVNTLAELFKMIPFSESTKAMFQDAENQYMKQVEVIGRMNDFKDYLISLFMIAILPSLFEEVIFRGGMQNLLSRWWKSPILAIIVTSLVFSAVHFSYYGFFTRVALGFLLGWVYHRTGNLWLSIIGHVVNNGFIITMLYLTDFKATDIAKGEVEVGPELPIWLGLVSLVVIYGLLRLFDKVSRKQIDRPGEEVPILVKADNPFDESNRYG